ASKPFLIENQRLTEGNARQESGDGRKGRTFYTLGCWWTNGPLISGSYGPARRSTGAACLMNSGTLARGRPQLLPRCRQRRLAGYCCSAVLPRASQHHIDRLAVAHGTIVGAFLAADLVEQLARIVFGGSQRHLQHPPAGRLGEQPLFLLVAELGRQPGKRFFGDRRGCYLSRRLRRRRLRFGLRLRRQFWLGHGFRFCC